MQRRRIPTFILAILASASVLSCASAERYADPLSEKLIDLANSLSELEDCAQKAEYFRSWLDKNASSLTSLKSSFDKNCLSGDPVCMSYQILGSAKIEVELRSCIESDPELIDRVNRLNDISGTAIVFLNDAAR